MTPSIDELIETLHAHEDLAPDATTVLDATKSRVKTARRVRLAARATGVSVLGAGIVAGGLDAPALFRASHGAASLRTVNAGDEPTPSPSPSYTDQQAEQAYFSGGYDYTNAQQLARIWNEPVADIGSIKIKAGTKLLQGETLPVKPDLAPAPPVSAQEQKDVDAFFKAGYDYNDAAALAKAWNLADAYHAKIKGGQKLIDGDQLPIPPSAGDAGASSPTPAGGASAGESTTVLQQQAFFDAGYDYGDAQQLATIWNETDINRVKAQAGADLMAGRSLPVKPSGQPAPADQQGVDTFFAAGYDYNDAVTLAKLWNLPDAYHAKLKAGQQLLAGQTLPIQP
jgi:hypothetical protein